MLHVSKESERRIQEFFATALNVVQRFQHTQLRMTVYHARSPLAGVVDAEVQTAIEVIPIHWRFMLMKPGDENPRPRIVPFQSNVGIRSAVPRTPIGFFLPCARGFIRVKVKVSLRPDA